MSLQKNLKQDARDLQGRGKGRELKTGNFGEQGRLSRADHMVH